MTIYTGRYTTTPSVTAAPLRITDITAPVTGAGDADDMYYNRIVSIFDARGLDDSARITDDNGTVVDRGDLVDALTYFYDVPRASLDVDIDGIDNTVDRHIHATAAFSALTGVDIYGVDDLHADKLPAMVTRETLSLPPLTKALYTIAGDVVEPLSADRSTYDNDTTAIGSFFIGTTSIFNPSTLGIAVDDHTVFFDYLNFIKNNYRNYPINKNTEAMFQDFVRLDIDDELLIPLRLRSHIYADTEDYSFQRVLVALTYQYLTNCDTTAHNANKAVGIYPLFYSLLDAVNPASIVFINLHEHTRHSVEYINEKWSRMSALTNENIVSPMSLSKITRLDAADNSMNQLNRKRLQQKYAAEKSKRKMDEGDVSGEPTSIKKMATVVMEEYARLKNVRRSQNVYRKTTMSYTKQSRRHPDSPDAQGKITRRAYLPDLHFYVDTSGSISEKHYKQSVLALAIIAKKLGVNVYFTSFSHTISEPIMIPVKGKSVQAISAFISAIPKVGGGTDFDQVYQTIQKSKAYRQRLNIMITDFEWSPAWTRTKVDHPDNLIYLPSFNPDSAYAWNNLRWDVKTFYNEMLSYVPDMARRIRSVTA